MSILWDLIGQLVLSDWLLGGVYAELWADVSGMTVVWQIGTDRRFQVRLSTTIMYSLLVIRIMWGHVLYLVWVYSACNPESFPLEVADGAVCWSAEVTAQHHRRTGHLQRWMQRKTSRPHGWVMAFNSGQIYSHALKCVFSFSVPLSMF